MPRRPIGDKPMTAAERQRKRRERLNQQRPAAPIERAQEEIERLKRRITQLETELLTASARRGEPKPAPEPTAPTTDAERVIKRLRERNRMANAEIRFLRSWAKTTGLPERGGMSQLTYRMIVKALHPDTSLTKVAQTAAITAFNNWVDGLKPEKQ